MTGLTIGRAGTETGLELGTINSVSVTGDHVSLSGVVRRPIAQVAQLRAIEWQLGGYHGNEDEQVVPVTVPSKPLLSGMYRIDAVGIGAISADQHAGCTLPWSAELTRVADFRSPGVEQVVLSKLRTNSHTITAFSPLHAVPLGAAQYYDGVSTPGYSDFEDFGIQRWTDDGDWGVGRVRLHELTTPGSTRSTPRHTVAPDDWYVGGCRVTYLDSTGTRRTLVGRQLPEGVDLLSLQVSNGTTRVGFDTATVGINDALMVEVGALLKANTAGAATWVDKAFYLKQDTLNPAVLVSNLPDEAVPVEIGSAAVVANGIECVSLRLTLITEGNVSPSSGTGAPFRFTDRSVFDITLRRGSMVAECVWSTDYSLAKEMVPPSASTTFTGGERETTATSGTHWVLMSPTVFAGSTSKAFGVGHIIASGYGFDQGALVYGGSYNLAAPTPANTLGGLEIRDQYFAAVAEGSLAVVGR